MRYMLLACLLFVVGCTGVPKGIAPVASFDLTRYLGTRYEIYRLDHSYERGMQGVTATYSRNEDGSVKVLNTGIEAGQTDARASEGKALFVQEETTGHLKVSFFPFVYGSYVIFELGEDYSYAMVTSHNRDSLWLLARTPDITPELDQHFLTTVAAFGFDMDELIRVEHY
jgi:apolipoprotein D and lipocalin family protein